MTRYVVGRVLSSLFVLFVVITASLWLTRLAPSNPCTQQKAGGMCQCMVDFKLDRPVFPVYTPPPASGIDQCRDTWEADSGFSLGPVRVLGLSQWTETQYAIYMGNLVTGDLGQSMRRRTKSVNELLAGRAPATLWLGVQALLLALVLGIPAGMFAGLKQNTWADYITMTVAMVGIAVPNFVLGPLLILAFAEGQQGIGLVAPGGWNTFSDTILPSITLAAYYTAYIARLTRGGILEMIRKDFVRTARAKGLKERTVVLRHALKGTLLPVVSYLGPAFAALLTGSVVVEQIFNVPGIGTFFVESALNRDYNVILGTVIIYSSLLVTLNLLVDIAYTFIDPRVSYDEQ